MKIESPFLNKLGGLLGAAFLRHYLPTLNYRVAYYDRAVDPAFPECQGQKIYIFWHEYILAPLTYRGHCNLVMLVSRHRDAEILSHVAHHMGFEFVRGSTNRGGVGALRELLRKSRQLHLTITPDGPRGPRRVLAPGAVFLASRLGLPIVAMGIGYDRPWRLPTWDKFALPRPFSQARAIISPELHIPADLDRDGLEEYRQRTEQFLNRLTAEAEDWAASGTRRIGEQPVIRRPAPVQVRRFHHPHRLSGDHATGALQNFDAVMERLSAKEGDQADVGQVTNLP